MTRVLLIEDEDAYRETVGYLLRKEGFDVVEAAGDPDAPRLNWLRDAFRADDA